MEAIDWFSLIIISAFSISGLFNGFTKELFSSFAWIISIVAAWFFGPLLFPIIEIYISNENIKSIVSFCLLFLLLFILIKFLGSIIYKFMAALGLKFLDKAGGLIFGAMKATAILVSVYMLCSSVLDQQKWWIDSVSREYTIKIAEVVEPLLRKWKTQSEILLDKENVTFPPSV